MTYTYGKTQTLDRPQTIPKAPIYKAVDQAHSDAETYATTLLLNALKRAKETRQTADKHARNELRDAEAYAQAKRTETRKTIQRIKDKAETDALHRITHAQNQAAAIRERAFHQATVLLEREYENGVLRAKDYAKAKQTILGTTR